jgi:hypothetical protein
MKKSDIALLILIASITLVISFLLVKALFGEPSSDQTKVEKVQAITGSLDKPPTSVFNKDAINPTVVIQIGDPANQQPFGGQ